MGRYNWITPNLYNDQHTSLSGGFVYHGIAYANDQAAVAQGDNFIATVVPLIMASSAYQDHGAIIIRWDESEGGDGTNFTIPEIVISPLAKGNAYASSQVMNHSSHVKTMDEIFGLVLLTNAVPSGEVCASGPNSVSAVNDLSDMFPVIDQREHHKFCLWEECCPSRHFSIVIHRNFLGQTYRVLASDAFRRRLSPVGRFF